MPNYDYECQSCGHTFETSQRITEKALTDCPQCKQPKLQRLISAPAFHLKGGGWYKDGYGNTKHRSENQVTDRLQKAINDDKKKTETASSSGGDSGSSSSTDSSAGSSSAGGSSGGSSGSSSE